MPLYGLIGKSLTHSFSRVYFREKFAREGCTDCEYRNFELRRIEEFPALLQQNPQLQGLNVTIPYKQAIMPFLDQLQPEAQAIGAVNTVLFNESKSIGANTDYYGFWESLQPHLHGNAPKALILGSGGAAQAVAYALKIHNIPYRTVSRHPQGEQWTYARANAALPDFTLIVNTTPLGTFPHTDAMPPLAVEKLTAEHLVYDLVYNPAQTLLLQKAGQQGAKVCNGLKMLQLQAKKSWELWNEL